MLVTPPGDPHPPASTTPSRRQWSRRRTLVVAGTAVGVLFLLGVVTVWEVRTSTLQSIYFSRVGGEITYSLAPGPSSSIRFPAEGPFDARLGYPAIPAFVERATARGFNVVEQAQVSTRFGDLMASGYFPIYKEKAQGGLTLQDQGGGVFFASPHPARIYAAFDSIPDVLGRSLV